MNDNIFTKCDNPSDSPHTIHNHHSAKSIGSSTRKQIPKYNEKTERFSQIISENRKGQMVSEKDGKSLQEKLESIDKNYPLDENLDTEKKCQMLLNNIQNEYTNKESLQEMLDETLSLLKEQENENDQLKIRCREYLKIIDKQYNKIKQLENLLETYDDKVFKKNFIKKYI